MRSMVYRLKSCIFGSHNPKSNSYCTTDALLAFDIIATRLLRLYGSMPEKDQHAFELVSTRNMDGMHSKPVDVSPIGDGGLLWGD